MPKRIISQAQKEKAAKDSRELRAWYKAGGVCIQCGKGWAEPGHVRCTDCMRKSQLYQKRHDPDGTKHKANAKARRDQRRANGLCTNCGAPTDGKIKLCSRCAAKSRESNRMYKLRQRLKQEAN